MLAIAGGAASVAPGVFVVGSAFSTFVRIYSYVPLYDLAVLVSFGVIFPAFLVLAVRAGLQNSYETWVVISVGIGLGFGYSSVGVITVAGIFVFSTGCVLSCLGVGLTLRVDRGILGWMALLIGALATLFCTWPAFFMVTDVSTHTLLIRDLVAEMWFASGLALLASATYLGLVAAVSRGLAHGAVPPSPRRGSYA